MGNDVSKAEVDTLSAVETPVQSAAEKRKSKRLSRKISKKSMKQLRDQENSGTAPLQNDAPRLQAAGRTVSQPRFGTSTRQQHSKSFTSEAMPHIHSAPASVHPIDAPSPAPVMPSAPTQLRNNRLNLFQGSPNGASSDFSSPEPSPAAPLVQHHDVLTPPPPPVLADALPPPSPVQAAPLPVLTIPPPPPPRIVHPPSPEKSPEMVPAISLGSHPIPVIPRLKSLPRATNNQALPSPSPSPPSSMNSGVSTTSSTSKPPITPPRSLASSNESLSSSPSPSSSPIVSPSTSPRPSSSPSPRAVPPTPSPRNNAPVPPPRSFVGGAAAVAAPPPSLAPRAQITPNKARPLPTPVPRPLPKPEPTMPEPGASTAPQPAVLEQWPYKLGEVVGTGAFSEVMAAIHKVTGIKCAVKVIDKELLRQICQADQANMLREIEVIKSIDHPHIMSYYSHLETEDKIYIATELLSGGEVLYQVAQYANPEQAEDSNEEAVGNYTEADARAIMEQIMRPVHFLHQQGLVHRDMKPENLMFTSKSANATLKLIDFGLATYITSENPTLDEMCGTPDFQAPEMIKRQGYGFGVDIWAVGIIFYILLCGRPPFKGRSTVALHSQIMKGVIPYDGEQWEDVSQDAKDLLKGMLAYDASQRLTAKQVLEHPWMVNKSLSVASPIVGSSFRGELKKYNSFRFFKATEQELLKSQRFSVFSPPGSPLVSPNVNYRLYK